MASLSIMVLPSLLAGSHQSVAGHRAGCFEGPEVGFVKIPHTNSYRLSSSVHFIKPLEGTLAPSGSPNQSTSTGRSMGDLHGLQEPLPWESAASLPTLLVAALQLGEGAILSSSTITRVFLCSPGWGGAMY